MDTTWLNDEEMAAWVRLAAVLELLPGVLDSPAASRRRADALRVLRARDAVGGAAADPADDGPGGADQRDPAPALPT